jgi:hypothetical protein
MMPQEESDSTKSAGLASKVDKHIELIESDQSQLLPEVVKAKQDSAAEQLVDAGIKASSETRSNANVEAKNSSTDSSTSSSTSSETASEEIKRQPNLETFIAKPMLRIPAAAKWWLGIILSIPILFLSSRGDSPLFIFAPVLWLVPRGDSHAFLCALFLASAYWSFCIYKNFADVDSRLATQISPWRAALFSMGASPSGIAGLLLLLDLAVAYCTQAALSICKFLQGTWLFDVVSVIIFVAGISLMVLPFVLTYRWYFIVAKSALLARQGQEPTRHLALLVGGTIASAIAGPNLVEIFLFLVTRHDYSTSLPMNYLYGLGMMLAFAIAMMAQRKKSDKE